MIEVDYCKALLLRWPAERSDTTLFRRNTGAIKIDGRMFRAGIKGQCDFYAIGASGYHYEIEVKRHGQKLSPHQINWRDWCLAHNVPWLLLDVERGELPAATIERWVSELRGFFR